MLQGIGAISLIAIAVVALLNGFIDFSSGASRVEHELVSPSGRYRAIHALTSTGAVGYCYQFIVLVPASHPVEVPSYSKSKDKAVFAARCDSKVEMGWLSDTHLKVTLDIASGNEVHRAKLLREDPSSQVQIQYEVITK
ncbi:hypothetical protein [Ideonella sp.]|uniref:hypothetical protein n=1 Tax=Ideonella sp. TaxID=1929293 RepID=UPI003BB6FAD0